MLLPSFSINFSLPPNPFQLQDLSLYSVQRLKSESVTIFFAGERKHASLGSLGQQNWWERGVELSLPLHLEFAGWGGLQASVQAPLEHFDSPVQPGPDIDPGDMKEICCLPGG